MRLALLLTVILFSTLSIAQIGGGTTYQFLNLENSARIAASGGNLIAVKDNDLSLGFYNPALLNESMHGFMGLNHVNYVGDVNYSYAGYAHHIENVATFSGTIQYLNYGKFKRTDEFGTEQGEFSANELALVFGVGHEFDSLFSIGANLKIVNSVLESYSSFGIGFDIAGTYHRKAKGFVASAVVKNAGVQLSKYTSGNKEKLPFEVQLGFSKKLAHAPFRFHAAFTNLQQWDLTYSDPNAVQQIDPITQLPIEEQEPGFGDKLMRHIILGLEFVPTKNFFIDLGFDYRRRKELSVEARPGLVGVSMGGGFKLKKFHLAYARSSYHRASGAHHITISSKLSYWTKK